MKPASNYITTIGIECHVQLKTKTKLFAAVTNADFGAAPNTTISPICLGMPGSLPVLNEAAVKQAIKLAFGLNTEPQRFSKFDRKNYFYPDLPKGYQITQLDHPIILGGYVEIWINGELKKIRINRAHLEEDAGKSIHPAGKDYSLVDLNRAGTPLLEIVSEPDMHSAEEARQYAHELYLLVRYADVSNADLYHGNMRFDVNVSVSKDPSKLGTRTETKNLNSFRSVEKAVEFEVKRQVELLEKGQSIKQETRGWDEAKQKGTSQRSKEEANDYRYFPEPDVPPLELSEDFIKSVDIDNILRPNDIRSKLGELKLDSSAVETLVEAVSTGLLMLELIKTATPDNAKRIANWLATEVQAMVASGEVTWDSAKLESDSLIKLADAVSANELSSTGAKSVLSKLVLEGGDPMTIAKDLNLVQVNDETALEDMVKTVMNDNPKAVEDLRKGEDKSIGFLIGQVMKLSKGQANPQIVTEIIKRNLS
jgi:aspartyl-tRNA(Asn)/glutamyl-tRNA(Gln) amidotransferase subunit B